MLKEAYLETVKDVLSELRVRSDVGLSSKEAVRRLKELGPNILPRANGRSAWLVFADRFKDVLVIVLLVAGLVSILLQRYADAVIIGAAILIDAALSFAQVWRTERTLEKIRDHLQPVATVFRDGKLQKMAAGELVRGDIIEVRAGENVPADVRLIQSNGIRLREAALTGESGDVEKSTAALKTRTPMSDRVNMLFMGTTVVSGVGRAVVISTGTRTEFGKIAQLLKTEKSPLSPLAKKLRRVGLHIGSGVIIAVGLLFVLGLLSGQDVSETLFTAITLVVSAIPEDLTMILTIALTVGVSRILRQKGLVRDLRSGETLGAATVICTDKTGTLTEGKMRAREFDSLQGSILSRDSSGRSDWQTLALKAMVLSSTAHRLGDAEEYVGTATEKAALVFADDLGLDTRALRNEWKKRDALSFSSAWKYRAELYDHPVQSTRYLFVTGAPEVLLERSSKVLSELGDPEDLTAERRYTMMRRIEQLAADGNRLLGVAVRRNMSQAEIEHRDVNEMLFLGVLLIEDPVREGVDAVIAQTMAAGVSVKMVTGDHPQTARMVARQIGIAAPEETVVTSESLAHMTDAELQGVVDDTRIFARITPVDKQRIVRALQARGHVVAMTGDGINDAVALRGADIGVAMGSGKDIAKEAADLVLLDDRFQTIVAAIREGRVIRDNIRKVIAFLLATNMAEVAIFFVSLAMGLPLPLLPAQILWVNLVTDGTSDVALSLEPRERGVMKRKPDDPDAPLISARLFGQLLYSGIIMTIATMSLYWYLYQVLGEDLVYARTMAFTLISMMSLLSVWSFRSLRESILDRGIFGNVWVFVSLSISAGLHLLAIYVPVMQRFFGTVGLALADWGLILAIAVIAIFIIDARKMFIGKESSQAKTFDTAAVSS